MKAGGNSDEVEVTDYKYGLHVLDWIMDAPHVVEKHRDLAVGEGGCPLPASRLFER